MTFSRKETHQLLKESSPLLALLQLTGQSLFLAPLTWLMEPRGEVTQVGVPEGPGMLMGRPPLPVPHDGCATGPSALLIKPALAFLTSSA